jgi:hypothetical protein
MKVRFESSGGFAGMHTSAMIDTDDHLANSEDAKRLQELVRDSNFFDIPSESPRPKPGSADYTAYKITVESEERSHTVRANDTTMPSKMWPLIRFLQSKAKINNRRF